MILYSISAGIIWFKKNDTQILPTVSTCNITSTPAAHLASQNVTIESLHYQGLRGIAIYKDYLVTVLTMQPRVPRFKSWDFLSLFNPSTGLSETIANPWHIEELYAPKWNDFRASPAFIHYHTASNRLIVSTRKPVNRDMIEGAICQYYPGLSPECIYPVTSTILMKK